MNKLHTLLILKYNNEFMLLKIRGQELKDVR